MRELENIVDEVVATDVLVIGGGLAGCFAAIAARGRGADVVVMEKADVRRSGDATFGIDHVGLRHDDPRISPVSPKEAARKLRENPFVDQRIPYEEVLAETYDRVMDLERMGCKVRRADGSFIRTPGISPATVLMMSVDQKKNLAQELGRLKVKVHNRTMMTDLLTYGGRVAGALGLNTRTGRFILFRAKAVVLATGKATRLYPNHQAPLGGFVVQGSSPACCGDGHAAAFRAGARLVNMEFSRYTLTPKNPAWWSSKGSMLHSKPPGLPEPLVDSRGRLLAELVQEEKGIDMLGTGGLYRKVWEMLKDGQGPLFYDMTSWPEENQKLITLGNVCERPIVLRYLRESGIDYRTHRVETSSLIHRCLELGVSGVKIDGQCRTSLPGLYAAGDIAGGTFFSALSGAITWGHRAGRFAAEYAACSELLPVDPGAVAEGRERVFRLLEGTGNLHWQELEKTIQLLLEDYVGAARNEPRMRRGRELLREVREKLLPQLKAANYHELMRSLEVGNILDVAEMHLLSALTRRETRFPGIRHYRIDYPHPDEENWRGKIVSLWREGEDIRIEILPPDQT
ncbi:MAG: hypothetical protein DRI26_05475 [Chloroflexi bacterium]|nr:MAG: hypothetical protein DRI26_05475 [Chloroflexota bacterium]